MRTGVRIGERTGINVPAETPTYVTSTLGYDPGAIPVDALYMATAAGGGSDSNPGTEGSPFLTLTHAVSQMSGGDTLVIEDGIYAGASNELDTGNINGKGGSLLSPTVIRARNHWDATSKVVFEDGFLNMLGSPGTRVDYMDFIGLLSNLPVGILTNTYGWRVIRCGVVHPYQGGTNNEALFAVGGQYHLIEDCWAAGQTRYGMYARSDSVTSHIIFRRCVMRIDCIDSSEPVASFAAYSKPDISFQNCIAIDADDRSHWINYDILAGGYYQRTGSTRMRVQGCMALNNAFNFSGGNTGLNSLFSNNIAWDVDASSNEAPRVMVADGDQSGVTINHMTVGNTNNTVAYFEGLQGQSCSVSDSIAYGASVGINGFNIVQLHNVCYSNTDDLDSGAAADVDADTFCTDNANSVDPLAGSLEYLPRIESGSALSGTASDSADRGATILYAIGESGTRHTETDWETTTTDRLWPFPNEARIRDDFKSFPIPTSPASLTTIDPDRGFCATGQTLTKYIWEYLGNTIPANVSNGTY